MKGRNYYVADTVARLRKNATCVAMQMNGILVSFFSNLYVVNDICKGEWNEVSLAKFFLLCQASVME